MEELTEYELKLKRAFYDAAAIIDQKQITDLENWDYLMMNLLRLKLLSIKD